MLRAKRGRVRRTVCLLYTPCPPPSHLPPLPPTACLPHLPPSHSPHIPPAQCTTSLQPPPLPPFHLCPHPAGSVCTLLARSVLTLLMRASPTLCVLTLCDALRQDRQGQHAVAKGRHSNAPRGNNYSYDDGRCYLRVQDRRQHRARQSLRAPAMDNKRDALRPSLERAAPARVLWLDIRSLVHRRSTEHDKRKVVLAGQALLRLDCHPNPTPNTTRTLTRTLPPAFLSLPPAFPTSPPHPQQHPLFINAQALSGMLLRADLGMLVWDHGLRWWLILTRTRTLNPATEQNPFLRAR